MCWGDEDARRFVSEQPSALLTISGGRLLSCCQRGGSQPRCTCEATGPTPSLPGPPQGVLTAASAEPRALSPTCTRHPQSLTGRHHQGTGRWMPLTPAHSAGTDLSPCVPPSDGKAAEGLRAVWTSLGGGLSRGPAQPGCSPVLDRLLTSWGRRCARGASAPLDRHSQVGTRPLFPGTRRHPASGRAAPTSAAHPAVGPESARTAPLALVLLARLTDPRNCRRLLCGEPAASTEGRSGGSLRPRNRPVLQEGSQSSELHPGHSAQPLLCPSGSSALGQPAGSGPESPSLPLHPTPRCRGTEGAWSSGSGPKAALLPSALGCWNYPGSGRDPPQMPRATLGPGAQSANTRAWSGHRGGGGAGMGLVCPQLSPHFLVLRCCDTWTRLWAGAAGAAAAGSSVGSAEKQTQPPTPRVWSRSGAAPRGCPEGTCLRTGPRAGGRRPRHVGAGLGGGQGRCGVTATRTKNTLAHFSAP